MKKNMIIQAALLICAILFLITSSNISTLGFNGDVLNQKNYVIILSWLLIVLSTGGVIREYLLHRKNKHTEEIQYDEEEMQSDGIKISNNSRMKIVISMILLFVFVLGFTYIGYYVTSLIFVFLLTWLMFDWARKKWVISLMFSVGLNGILFILFNLINVYFPKTLLF
ncbi:tripartite tricarboxylate transporter TctB family protein [Robertmurraya massiliosenegalensis]|uniref:tripartite tricarboxylate transporter TctB family protein n=1 Tax=Robertmurraya massiliosenegalensis TaxID=1287657 RepID=UPI0003103F44|nr:tripartite tricarboxylate transporter TctB family protein [Robertmurraya massiliosenegalensis]